MNKFAKLLGLSLMNIIMAPLTLAVVASRVYAKPTSKISKFWIFVSVFISVFSITMVFLLLQIKFQWAWSIAFFGYLTFCVCIATVRKRTREKLDIPGHIVEDFLASFFLYPIVVLQLKVTLEKSTQ